MDLRVHSNMISASAGRSRLTRDSQFFVFMLTEKDSAKIRYGICLNFFQAFERKTPPVQQNGGPRKK